MEQMLMNIETFKFCKKFLAVLLFLLLICDVSFVYSGSYFGSRSESQEKKIKSNPEATIEIYDKETRKTYRFNLLKYDDKLYNLAYKIFLMNQDVKGAYLISEAAVKQKPNDAVWRERYAQTAVWIYQGRTALKQWMELIPNPKYHEEALKNAIEIAKRMNNYDVLIQLYGMQLHEQPNNETIFLNYVDAIEQSGKPHEALALLEKIPGNKRSVPVLQKIASIQKSLNSPSGEINALNQLIAQSPNSAAQLRRSEILYSTGKDSHAYKDLLSEYKQPGNKTLEFWRTLGELAWYNNDMTTAEAAYRHVITMHDYDTEALYRLIEINNQNDNSPASYRYAKMGWEKYHTADFAQSVILALVDQKKWKELGIFLNSLPKIITQDLSYNPSYWIGLASVDYYAGRKEQSYAAFQYAIKRWPTLLSTKSDYLWLLINNDEKVRIKIMLGKWWKDVSSNNPYLIEPYAAGKSYFGDYKFAAILIHRLVKLDPTNFRWMMDYATALDETNHSDRAYFIFRKAWYQLVKQVQQKPYLITSSENARTAFVELALLFTPNEQTVANIVIYLTNHYPKDNSNFNDMLINWALEESSTSELTNSKDQHVELANYIDRYQRSIGLKTMPSSRLNLALLNNDRYEMRNLLENELDRLPYRDRVLAAERLRDIDLAEELSYKGLSDHPTDYQMYEIFQDVMLKNTNKITSRLIYYSPGDVTGLEADLWATLRINSQYYITPYNTSWWPHIIDKLFIVNTPTFVRNTGVKLKRINQNGYYELIVGERKSLQNYGHASLEWQQIVNRKFTNELEVGYHVMPDEDAPLILAGMKNQIREVIKYQITPHDSVDITARLQAFYGQDNSYLGYGENSDIYFTHKFQLEYPDWNINLDIANYTYKKNGHVDALLRNLIPTIDQTPLQPAKEVGFYIPQNSLEFAATVGFGQDCRKNYTGTWRPFAEVGVLYNTVAHLGPMLLGGIAGKVLGRDHLTFYGEYIKNQVVETVNYEVGLRYEYYFS